MTCNPYEENHLIGWLTVSEGLVRYQHGRTWPRAGRYGAGERAKSGEGVIPYSVGSEMN